MIGPMHLIVKVIVSYGWYDFDKMAVFSEKISIKNKEKLLDNTNPKSIYI